MDNWIDISNMLLAFIAIGISIFTWNKSELNIKKSTEKTFNKDFFQELYFKDITNNLPSALSKVLDGDGNIKESCENAGEIICRIISKSLFYKHFDKEFYTDICKCLTEIDDKLVDIPNIKNNQFKLIKYREHISKLTDKFYDIMKNYYFKL